MLWSYGTKINRINVKALHIVIQLLLKVLFKFKMDEEEILIFNHIVHNQHEAEIMALAPPRLFLPKQNPFETLSAAAFLKCFRVSKELATIIINRVAQHLPAPSRTSALSVETKVLVALRFFSFGSYQEITGSNTYTGVRQSSVSRSITEVCEVLNSPIIFNEWVHFPRNREELTELRARFYEKFHFPGIIGIIDCTHVAIVAPPTNDINHPEHIYVNRKNYHSLNVQLICDENLRIMNVNARFPGSTHDAYIWSQSEVSQVMEQIYRRDPQNLFYLLGDSGYPLRPWLLTPLRNVAPHTPEDRFNIQFRQIRNLIEQCNGRLKSRFRCLLKHRVLHYLPSKAAKITNACVVLHNMCCAYNDPLPPPPNDENMEIDIGLYNVPDPELPPGRVNPDLAAARRIQENLIIRYFNNQQ